MPGGGGTQRLPRLIGAQQAAPFLLQGESMTAEQAKEPRRDPRAGADGAAGRPRQGVGEGEPERQSAVGRCDKFKIPGGAAELAAGGSTVFTFGSAMLAKQTWGNYPAQKHILSAVYEGLSVPIDAGAAHREPLLRQDADDAGSEGHDPLAVPVDAGPVERRLASGGLSDRTRSRRPSSSARA